MFLYICKNIKTKSDEKTNAIKSTNTIRATSSIHLWHPIARYGNSGYYLQSKTLKMETINITIPQGLSREEEALLIGKILTKGVIGTKYCKAIGTGYEIQHLETQIIVTREPKEDVTITKECNCCKSIYDISLGKLLYHNYGGKVRKLMVCSDDCKQFVLNNFPRISDKGPRSKNGIKPLFFFDINYKDRIKN